MAEKDKGVLMHSNTELYAFGFSTHIYLNWRVMIYADLVKKLPSQENISSRPDNIGMCMTGLFLDRPIFFMKFHA